MYFFIGFIIWLSFASVFHVLNDFVLLFFISNTLSGSFLFTEANPPHSKSENCNSPSINDEFYFGAVRFINDIFITNNIIIVTTISMIISLDLLTGGIKLVGNQGLVILYCNAIQAYQK